MNAIEAIMISNYYLTILDENLKTSSQGLPEAYVHVYDHLDLEKEYL